MQVAKWGNSLAIRLPKALVEQLKLAPGDELVIVEATHRKLEVEKRDRRAEAMRSMQEFRIPLPDDYKFDREEANQR